MQYVNSIFGNLSNRSIGGNFVGLWRSMTATPTTVLQELGSFGDARGAQLGQLPSLRASKVLSMPTPISIITWGRRQSCSLDAFDANARRPVGVFAEISPCWRRRLIDTRGWRSRDGSVDRLEPGPLGKMCKWPNGMVVSRGMKCTHLRTGGQMPPCVEITPATVNDVEIGRQTELEAGVTLRFRQRLLPLSAGGEDQ